MGKITVIDSIMGSGKTSYMIQHMNEANEFQRFIYITPFLTEVKRIKESVTSRNFIEPNNANTERRKLRSLKELIVAGHDIVATHSLFQSADEELIELLTGSGYTLILDEVMDVIEKATVNQTDIRRLLSTGEITLDGNRVEWTGDTNDNSRYMDIRLLAQAGTLYYHRGKLLIWAFPPAVFHAFQDVFVMTYLFRGQLQRYYFDLFKFEYEFKAVKRDGDLYEMIDYDIQTEGRTELFDLIDLYEGKLNMFPTSDNAFGSNWLRNATGDILLYIRKNIYNYFRNIAKAKAKEIIWTTLIDARPHLRNKGYANSFIPHNTRATNEYADRWALAFVFNRYMHPTEKWFFEDHGMKIDHDMLAVSDLLQWVWRSRIRNGEPINLYLPSARMRRLLKAWANYEI